MKPEAIKLEAVCALFQPANARNCGKSTSEQFST